jgi:hypothetical protein
MVLLVAFLDWFLDESGANIFSFQFLSQGAWDIAQSLVDRIITDHIRGFPAGC